MGLECGVLAKMGWTASADVFGKGGFFDTFLNGIAEPELLVEGFGRPFRMVDPGVGFKKHPSNYFTHRPIDAALGLREEHKVDPRDIERVEVVFPRFEYVNRPQPKTGLDGKFSVQYTTAVALLDGEITIDSFTNERRFAPDVEALLPRVTLTMDDAIPADFDRMHAIVTVMLKSGGRHTRKVDKLSGWVGHPLTREERMRKFYSCSRRVLAAAAAELLSELVERLEHQADVLAIMDIARADAGARREK
jgi:aconitate decarboxylase